MSALTVARGCFDAWNAHDAQRLVATFADGGTYSEIAADMRRLPGFLGWTGINVGRRMMTVTAWKDVDAPRQLLSQESHARAMRRFFGSELGAGGVTGVWTPARLSPIWVRCPACARMAAGDRAAGGRCECGATLPEPAPYW